MTICVIGLIGIRFVGSFILSVSALTPEQERRMEKTIGMRIRECRKSLGMTQEELAEALYTKKSTISEYENDKIDLKISVLREIAVALKTTVSYLTEGDQESMNPEVLQVARMLQDMKDEKLRLAAIEQVKVLTRL